VQGLSWRVRLLPYLDQAALYDRFNQNEPWDGPTNKPLLALMPDIYKSPGAKIEDPTKTVFQVVTMAADGVAFQKQLAAADRRRPGARSVFDTIGQGPATSDTRRPQLISHGMRDILDGTSNTILIVEVDPKHAVPWTKPEDLRFEYDKPWAKLGTLRRGHLNFAMCDGSVGSIAKEKVDDQALRDAFFMDEGNRNNAFRRAIGSVKY